MPIDPALAARLPALHEAEEAHEIANVLAAGLGPALGIDTRAVGDVRGIRCASLPKHHPANQLTGLAPEALHDLGDWLGWYDDVGAWLHVRVPGPAVEPELGAALHAQGFRSHELEAWLAADLASFDVQATDHDIRPLDGPDTAEDFATAFLGGWGVTDPDKGRVATAAMAAWPGPSPWRRYVAYVDGVPAAQAVMHLEDGIAYLAEAATVPAYRKRGLQRALIARRAADAKAEGATVIFGGVVYGDASWANMKALGLREAMLSLTYRRPPSLRVQRPPT